MNAYHPLCFVLLGGIVFCGGQKSGDNHSGPCPEGYPYCATLDACLLPGKSCPPAVDAATVNDVGSAPGIDAASGAEEGGSDAFAQPDAPPLPLPPTPNQVRCGSALCDATKEYCCAGAGGSGGGGPFETCGSAFCGFRRECDETADCVGTEVCCYSVFASPPPILGSRCVQRSECGISGYWFGCGTQADCSAVGAPACVAQECGGATIQTCGPVTRSACR